MTDKEILKDWKKQDIVRAINFLLRNELVTSETSQKTVDVLGRVVNIDNDIIKSLYSLNRRISKLEKGERKRKKCDRT